jgi:hypothetical protein
LNENIKDSDLIALREAKILLENPNFVMKITDTLGAPIEKGLEKLPSNWQEKVNEITQNSLKHSINVAVKTMNNNHNNKPKTKLHTLSAAASGAVGGFFGLSAMAIELPISTTIMLRTIADIARSEGENIEDIETKLACLEVFALGGKSDKDDDVETGYYTIRAVLSFYLSEISQQMASKTFVLESSSVMVKFITAIAQRFGVQVTEKLLAQSIPVIGAVSGGLINTLFINHFQDMAKGHFIVRRLEREYSKDLVEKLYKDIKLIDSKNSN